MIAKAKKEDLNRLLEIWESAVMATHQFLTPSDYEFYKTLMPTFLSEALPNIYTYSDQDETISAFIAVNEQMIDMLFVHNDSRGLGFGKRLITFAINELDANKVDVNEQNTQGVGFYSHMGFEIKNRDEIDDFGKHYPILHLEL